jgi:glycosyltransferase involved in cell wall biosynthesis
MPSAALVSVVMNCYNSAAYLAEAIDSVYAQTYPHWEIVFIDNASTDESPAIARGYDERLRYIRNPETVSLGASRNVALQHCRGELIAFLDCDDLWAPQKLALQVPLFERAAVGLVYSNCWLMREGRRIGLWFTDSGQFAVGDALRRLIANYFLVLSSTVVRRSTLAALDEWFDPRLQVAEEADVFIRMAIDAELAMVDEPLATLRLHGRSESVRKMELYGVENLMVLDKLRRLVPEFDERYGAEAAQWINRGRWSRAVAAWKRGDGAAARAALREVSAAGWRHRVLYLATVVPYRMVRAPLNVARRRPWND